ncbi:DUF1636 domain-containing protein [Iodidimonas sp. SYSU 1G8]|uniref:DUF1636 domain-containing protein n=1 Tax=Iodidimonas sp. SYSU 1G8 TaxID=3133967 RepID=UPI0031FEA2F2
MLKKIGGEASIIVCSTCRYTADERDSPDGVRGGVLMARAVREAAAAHDDVEVQEMACLFACSQRCAVHLRAAGKIGYVLGKFEPSPEAARAIVDYFRLYTASDEGVVPYKDWPEEIKGHFLVRVPPAGFVTD